MGIPFVICSGILLLLLVVLLIIFIHYRGFDLRLMKEPGHRIYYILVFCLEELELGQPYYSWYEIYSHRFNIEESDSIETQEEKKFISEILQDSGFIFSHFSKINKKGVRKFITPLQLNMKFISQCKNDWDQRKAEKKATNLLEPLRNTLQPLIDGCYLTKDFEFNVNEDDKNRRRKAYILLEKIVDLCNINDKDKDAIAYLWGFQTLPDLSVNSKEDYDEQAEKDFNDYENKLEHVIRLIKGRDAITLLDKHRKVLQPLIDNGYLTKDFEPNLNEDDKNRRRKAYILLEKIVDLCEINDKDKDVIVRLWELQALSGSSINSKKDYDEQAEKDFKEYENQLEKVIRRIKGNDAIKLLEPYRKVLQPLIESNFLTEYFELNVNEDDNNRRRKACILWKKIANLCRFNEGYGHVPVATLWGGFFVSSDLLIFPEEGYNSEREEKDFNDYKNQLEKVIRRIKGNDATNLLEPHRDTLLPLIESNFLTEYFELNVNEDDNNRRRKACILWEKIANLCRFNDKDKDAIAYLWGFQALSDLSVNSKEDYDEQAEKDFNDYENQLEKVIRRIKGNDAIKFLEPYRKVLQPLINDGYLTKDFKPGDKINEERRYHKTGYLMKVIAKLCTFKNNDGYATKLAPLWGYKSVSALTTAANESLDESKTKGNLDDMKNDIKELTAVYITKSEKKAKKKKKKKQ